MSTKTAGTPKILIPIMEQFASSLGVAVSPSEAEEMAKAFVVGMVKADAAAAWLPSGDLEVVQWGTGTSHGEGKQIGGYRVGDPPWGRGLDPPEYAEYDGEFEAPRKTRMVSEFKLEYDYILDHMSTGPRTPKAVKTALRASTAIRHLYGTIRDNKRVVERFVRSAIRHGIKNAEDDVRGEVDAELHFWLDTNPPDYGPLSNMEVRTFTKIDSINITEVEVEPQHFMVHIEVRASHEIEAKGELDRGYNDYDRYDRYAALRSATLKLAGSRPAGDDLRRKLLKLVR